MSARDLLPAATHLRKDEILRLPHARGQRIEAISGGLWITIDHDLRDIVLHGGEGFTVDREGATLVSALDDASLVVLAPTPAPGHAPG